MPPVDTFITPNVLHNYFTATTRRKRHNWRSRLQRDVHLHARFTGAIVVKVWRTEHKSLCNLLFADVVQSHITENVCQGTMNSLYCLLKLIDVLLPLIFLYFIDREISFEDIEDEDIITRAWELPKRILIYCLYVTYSRIIFFVFIVLISD